MTWIKQRGEPEQKPILLIGSFEADQSPASRRSRCQPSLRREWRLAHLRGSRTADEVARLAATLKPLGCRFTVDAFGSVKGSFAPLRAGAFQFIKIDGIIVQNILRDPAQLARLRAIHAVCCKAGMRSIAEFVEDRETLSTLRKIGVHFVQGFGIERPEPLQS